MLRSSRLPNPFFFPSRLPTPVRLRAAFGAASNFFEPVLGAPAHRGPDGHYTPHIGSGWAEEQFCDPDQVVRGHDLVTLAMGALYAKVSALAATAGGLRRAKDLLDAPADRLAGAIR